jgi:ATP-dependent helicase/DNAse subunit B
VLIRGRIDRIDLADEGRIARVVDYKSGSSPIRVTDAEEGCNMQLPVYAMAVAQGARAMHSGATASDGVDHGATAGSNSAAGANANLPDGGALPSSSLTGVSLAPRFTSILPGLQVESGVYLSVSSGGSNGSINFQESAETLGKVKEKIAEFADRIRRGDFKIAPNDPQACKTCDHFSVCRISELASGRENEEEEA